MKKYLTAGFITLLPFALTVWIVNYCFEVVTAPLLGMMESLLTAYEKSQGISLGHYEILLTFLSRLLALILVFISILALGFLGRKFFFNAILNFAQKLVIRIPIIGTIFRLTKDITKAMIGTDQKSFQKTVLIPFPTQETHALGFVTGEVPESLKKMVRDAELTVFVPTSPHPVAGYVLLAPKKGIHDIDMTIEDAFKFLVTCGVSYPSKNIIPDSSER